MNNIQALAKKIENNGGRLYLVGGAIRDRIIGIESHDEDYCITGISLEDFKKLVPDAKMVGKKFPVFIYQNVEIAFARVENKVEKGYKGFDIIVDKNITIEEDLKRRDITINAIAQDVITGDIIDPYCGIEDIKNKLICPVSDSFCEDPLRAYRAARFAAKYDFELTDEILYQMAKLKEELYSLPAERVFEELKKALQTSIPSKFFKGLKKANLLDVHFKELENLVDVVQPIEFHPEGDVFNHTMIVLDKVAKLSQDESVMFSALCHDFGKALTPKEILPQHINHDINAQKPINDLCDRLKVPNIWRKRALFVAKYHMKVAIIKSMRYYKQAKLINLINKSVISLEDLEIIINADEMLDREKVEFSKTAREVLKEMNGKELISHGYYPEEIGKEKFLNLLYEKQAKLLQEKEEKAMKEKNNRFDLKLGEITQEDVEKENSYKMIKKSEPIELLKAIVEDEETQ